MSKIRQPTEESFLKDVAGHEMTIIRDDGVNRHVRFKQPGTSCYYFDLITWPGCLCYTGDMGTYVFSRLEDMFQFFRTDRENLRLKDGLTLAINLGYWSEKLIAVDGGRTGGKAEEFSEERFRECIQEYRLTWIRENRGRTTKDQRRELWEAIDNEVLSHSDEGEHEAMTAAHDFSHDVEVGTRSIIKRINRFEFTDFWDNHLTDYTYHFVWCCYALAWGIQQYDNAKAPAVAEVTP